MASPYRLSIVTTAYNEQDVIGTFCRETVEVVTRLTDDYELVVVDNGSTDDTLSIIKELNSSNENIRFVSLSRNFGYQGGLFAGLGYATGDAVITMDADLQHPPEQIPGLVEKWVEGAEIVTTRRTDEMHSGFFRRVANRIFYAALTKLTGMPYRSSQSDFRLMDRRSLNALLALPEREKFLRGLIYWIGFRQEVVDIPVADRRAGSSKFSPKQLLNLAMSGLVSFSILPLRLFSILGFSVVLLSVLYTIYIVVIWSVRGSVDLPEGWSSLALGIYLLGGIQLLGIGLIGEYVGKIMTESQRRPTYIVKESSIDRTPTDQSDDED